MASRQQKILIIKVGYSETLDKDISSVTSFGDVLRTTVLLNLYKDDHVTWLVDEKAFPILKNNPLINRLMIYNLTSVLQLQAERFDTVINLEKVPGLCALADQVTAWRRYGFRFDPDSGEAEAYDGTQDALKICYDGNRKRTQKRLWQEMLYEMVGAQWKGEDYVFALKPSDNIQYDIGFNYLVGTKWPSKGWARQNWDILESRLSPKYKISWQQGAENMNEYFDWINRCGLVVSNDSFGLHIALALRKKVVALFNCTNPFETYLDNKGVALYTEGLCALQPCYSPKCLVEGKPCDLSVDVVEKAILTLIGN
jgi:ADP-heptose:LPS heptosyltransferase